MSDYIEEAKARIDTEMLLELCPEIILFDGLEDAFVGVIEQKCGTVAACYDYKKIVAALVRNSDGEMTEEDAMEYADFNVVGAYCGPHTPAILYTESVLDEEDEG